MYLNNGYNYYPSMLSNYGNIGYGPIQYSQTPAISSSFQPISLQTNQTPRVSSVVNTGINGGNTNLVAGDNIYDNNNGTSALSNWNNVANGINIANGAINGISSLVNLGFGINSAIQNTKLTKTQIKALNQQMQYNQQVMDRQTAEYNRMNKIRNTVQKQQYATSALKTNY